jgi:polysaccharide export outer membrane protein
MRCPIPAPIAAVMIAILFATSSSFAAPPPAPSASSSSPFKAVRAPASPVFKEVPSSPGPASTQAADYVIGPQDELDINVFQIEDLSKKVKVESSGAILLPLIGQVQATGRTVKELSDDIALKLGEKYVKDPLVTVTVTESASQKVTVDGAVTQPGIYPISGNTTLSQAVALARGTIEDANLRQVAIFRNEGDKRMAAVFDLSAIRAGRLPDPPVLANDVIVVEAAGGRRLLRALGNLAPFIYLFRPY